MYQRYLLVLFFIAGTLTMTGCSGDSTTTPSTGTPTTPDNNTVGDENNNTLSNNNGTVTSAGIYIAEGSVSTYKFWGHPLLYNDKAYVRLLSDIVLDSNVSMKLLSYDMSSFTNDMNIADLTTNIIYAKKSFIANDANKKQFYDPQEIEGSLYFTTFEEHSGIRNQNSFIRYDLESLSEVYHQSTAPVWGEFQDKTFELARGWFMPFDSNNYIGIVDGTQLQVIHPADGSSYKYGVYDYYAYGFRSNYNAPFLAPASDNDHIYFMSSEYKRLYSTSFLSNDVEYGKRKDSDIEATVLDDFKVVHTDKNYYLSGYSSIVLDGENIYLLFGVKYDNPNDYYDQADLYLLRYNKSLQLQESTLLNSGSSLKYGHVTHRLRKYKDSIYFTYTHDQKHEMCRYDLVNNRFVFKHQIGDPDLTQESIYAVTGDTIVIPERFSQTGYSSYEYDTVFKVLDINDGHVLNTINHNELNKLNTRDHGVSLFNYISDENAIYFFGSRNLPGYYNEKKIIVKIDSIANKIQKSRRLFDNQHTGVMVDR